jgi:hypothetical protein
MINARRVRKFGIAIYHQEEECGQLGRCPDHLTGAIGT